MSLAPATKEISDHPSARAVVDPTIKAEKDKDVDRKLRFYGVIQAFRAGRLPSNAQIHETLEYLHSHLPGDTPKSTKGTPEHKLSPQGIKLVQDVRDIIKTANYIVQEKNGDELFQNFIWHTRSVDADDLKEGVKNGVVDTAPLNKEKIDQDGQEANRHLRTLLSLVLSNAEVRKLISDASLIARDLLSISASKASTLIAPSPDRLQNVDQVAPKDTFYTEGGRKIGPHETPVLETRIPKVGLGQQELGGGRVKMHPKHDEQPMMETEDGKQMPVGSEAKETYQQYHGVRQQGLGFAKEAAMGERQPHEGLPAETGPTGQRVNEVLAEGERKAREAKEQAKREGEEFREADGEGREVKKTSMLGRFREAKDNLFSTVDKKIPEEHKEKVNEHTEKTKKFFAEEYFPEERRDQFIYRFKKVVLECQKHDDYQASMRWLLDFVDEYAEYGRQTTDVLAGTGKDVKSKHHALRLATLELRTLLERFANGMSMDVIFDAYNVLLDDSKRDPELKDWGRSVRAYIRKVLLEPGYILEPASDTEARRLRDTGKHFYQDKYSSEFNALFESAGRWINAMGEDPLNKRFGDDWARLTRDLLFDSEGSLKFKPELWNDVRKVILPSLVQKIGYFPIPRIEYTDDSLDLVVENLTLQGRNLLPNIIEAEVENYMRFSPYDAIPDDSHHRIDFTLSQIQADMRDVAFYYNKKTGLPRMKDSGLADVLIGGNGITAHISLHSTPRSDTSSLFKVHSVNVKIDGLKFSIRDSKHDFLYKTLRPLATGLVKKQIQKAIRDAVVTGLEYVDGRLVEVRNRMEEAKREEGASRKEVLQEIFTRAKVESPTASVSAGSASLHTKDSHFKVVSDKRHSLLSNVGNPAGWVNRSAEKNEKAKEGQEWRSEAFTIVRSGHGAGGQRAQAV